MCHTTDTMWHTENRIPRYKPQTTTKSIPKFSALRLKRSSQDTGYEERMRACKKTKGTHFSTGPTTSSRHSKNGLERKLMPSDIGIHKLISSVIRLKYTQNIEQPREVSEVLKFI